MKNNYINPFREETVFPIILEENSSVSIELFEEDGKKLFSLIEHQNLSAGKQTVKISRSQLHSGIYFAKITIENSKGKLKKNIKVTVN